jgi:hypothetical protein
MMPRPSLLTRLKQTRLPVAALAALLQRTPAVRIAAVAADYVLESPAGAVLKAAAASVAALGAVDSVAGASTSTASLIADVALPANLAVGQSFRMDVTVTGTAVTFAKSWDVSNTLPPGITVLGATLTGNSWIINDATIYKGVLTIQGSATKAGNYTFSVDAWQNINRSGSVTSGSTSINVTAPTGGTPTGNVPTISAQPTNQTVDAGSNVTLSVTAAGTPTPSYQWQKNGVPVSGATNPTLTFSPAQATDSGSYAVVITNTGGSVTSQSVTLTVNNVIAAPAFTAQPVSQTIAAGSTVVFKSVASGAPTPTFQWEFNGAPISGATSPALMINGATAASAGTYTCVATNSGGTVTSAAATLTVTSTPDIGRLVNISCRANVGTGGNILIAGFVVGGDGTSGSENVLARASGPALVPFNVSGALPDPQLQLFQGQSLLGSDSGWGGDSKIAGAAASVGAFSWSSPTSHDSALLGSLQGGAYTAQVSGASGDTGVALAEIYDDTPAGTYTPSSPRITNISARVMVGTGGNVLIAGFAIGGSTSRTVLIRASGPSLIQFGVTGTLPDPKLQLMDSSGSVIASNSSWAGDPQVFAAALAVGAFNWPFASSNDSAILVTLPHGTYTAQVSGATGDTGIALVEVYEVP